MGIISCASGSSCWRGLDYYKNNKVKKLFEEEYEKYQNKEYENTIKYINNMSKKELVLELTYTFDYAPEWVYDNFIRRNDIDGK